MKTPNNPQRDLSSVKKKTENEIIVDENYPGPKEEDIGNAEKPGINEEENADESEG